jgi:hypothetical protein
MHGMHGHGSKPHLCIFSNCERAQQGNGFPRRYNLLDHMKRVHDYVPKEPSSQESSPSTSTSAKAAGSRKRKSSSDQVVIEKRQKTILRAQTAILPQETKADILHRHHQEWLAAQHELMQHLQMLRYDNVEGHSQLIKLAEDLQAVSKKMLTLG